ncbi:hypothetical protein EV421DRAFT_1428257 [Armillaria borealis]|uniref:F-box domain-containing protein n=1 Tax=Armillaria borealis TaxID=47425 RepID=A0AA39IZV3_9AGAR|nr:hypothetical protein EV421DRAFT_1428257 [Armillaria borealis]
MSLSQSKSPIPVTAGAHTLSRSLLRCPECGYAPPEKSIAPTLPSSRFEELSSCNDAPLDSERTSLETVVREGEASLSSLPHRIAAAREMLRILLQEETRTVKHITDAKVLLNPVRRLPADVLIDIFAACLPEHTDYTDSLDAKSAPWVLSQVCAFWRQTALASTELWARVQLKMDLYANHALCVFRLGTVLHRAGMRPLEVNIQGRRDFSHHPVLAMILPTSVRWTSLGVIAPLHSFRLFNSISHQLPLLETLHIKVSSANRSDIRLESKLVIYGFCKAPHLQELSLTQGLTSDMSFFPRLFAVPLETISRLDLDSTPFDAVSLLQSNRAKHMITAVIALVESERHVLPQQIEIPVIRHACLRNLFLADSAAGLLSRLRLPALQNLMLSIPNKSILPTISEHTVPKLTKLTINCSRSIGRALASMLQWTPDLREMTLETVLKSDALFIALGRSRDGVPELVPNLETISLEGTALEFSGADRAVEDMVEARRVIAPGEGRDGEGLTVER